MADLATYDRAAHNAACPCKDCIAYDAAVFYQNDPRRASHWRTGSIERMLTSERPRNLNWAIEPGGCFLCGGDSIHVSTQLEHYVAVRHNPVWDGDKLWVSLLISRYGSWFKVYQRLLQNRDPRKPLRETMARWVCLFLDYPNEKCFALASREHEDWIEVRLGFIGLTAEELDASKQREPEYHRALRRGQDGRRNDPSARNRGRKIQGEISVAG